MADWTKLFTFTTVTEVTGEAEHERLEEIEVIFGTFERIDANALWKCKNLQRLAMINCSLTQISNLEAVGESLVHLCLSNQNITKMSGLSTLRQLRHLYLQQNRISRIEGLESCRHLRTLWLYDNCLTAVGNLGYCTDLRELWLQYLRKLIVLGQLTFEDENFGSNPIVTHPDYRSLAITTLNQLRQLDGIPIHAEERTTAEDQFFTQTMEFNDQIAELTLAYQQELRSITTRNERGVSHTHTLQQELIQALNDVEACVTAGQSKIQEEKLRQLQLREQHSQLLRDNVTKLQEDICASIKEHFEQEEKALQEEERDYEVMELETMAEQNQALAIAALQNAFPTKIAFQQLLQHMPDYRYIAESFRRPTNQQQEAVYATGHLDDREVDTFTLLEGMAFTRKFCLNLCCCVQSVEISPVVIPSLKPDTTTLKFLGAICC
ncbi:hypothetical protein BBJ29_004938 [Phytophthora kernoviae]|uniref:U2A'/phosphoprotein 32 family A C-terminal domain-containing protein n=1 Tax=Phytophthora kernoviae TaxID=325452 RepID=A0A3F2S1I1_9STRA|nr:hypothetical protein BBP00_00001324 [Phytophthora kernoviae]RLN70639.1 hypothetical protein BBJ29_004938 [Phytophthora kernoviae]